MDKIAQERTIRNKIREGVNLSGKALERINPEFKEIMDKMRTTDDKVRVYAEEIKKLVRAATTSVNRRDYLTAATNLSAFHERCRYISAELKQFIGSIDMKHYSFLLDQFDDEQKQQLFGYDPNKELDLERPSFVDDKVITAALKKQAGISDWWFKITDPISDLAHNLTTDRGRAMRAFEKRFSVAFLKDLKNNSTKMVEFTQRFLQFLIGTFKKLASARSTRNMKEYTSAASNFIVKFSEPSGYHNKFVEYYSKHIIPLKDQYEKLTEETRKIEEEKLKELDTQEQKSQLQQKMQEQFVSSNTPGSAQSVKPNLPSAKEKENALKELEKQQGPDKDDSNIPIPLTQEKKKAKMDFIKNIEKRAIANDPKSLFLEILAYSNELEDISPTASLKLLAIAEGLMEDYKTAGIFDVFKGKKEENPVKQEKVEPSPLRSTLRK